MIKILKMVFCLSLAFFLAFGATIPIQAQAPDVEKKPPQTIQEIVDEVAPMFGEDPKLIGKISYCESHWNSEAIHDKGHGKGVSGYHKLTFERRAKAYFEEYQETLNYDSSYDQLKLMSYDFSKGETYRRAWTTYRAYVNGGVYIFFSKLMNQWYTVTCK